MLLLCYLTAAEGIIELLTFYALGERPYPCFSLFEASVKLCELQEVHTDVRVPEGTAGTSMS